MKAPLITHTGLLMLTGLVLSTSSALAGQVPVSNFDDPNDATLWSWESWSSPASTEFDTLNAGGGAAGSGSMRVINNFPNNPGGYSQAVVTLNLGANVDAETLYTNISFDIKLDPSSYPRVNGTSYGGIQVIFRNRPNWDWDSLGFVELTAAGTQSTDLSFPGKAPRANMHHLNLNIGE